ncbi:MAG: hypothetical protein II931_02730 [Clostridia bacterium]|nr:hypothetical protein [Clostridia bacterium]
MKQTDMPMGFGMALAQNMEALNKFAQLSENQKQEIIDSTHTVNSKDDMKKLVNKIAADY